ncbi:MAG TPA: Ig-like domain-containing protein [Vicinamibacterales bacterium]|jgi:hypothetical protein
MKRWCIVAALSLLPVVAGCSSKDNPTAPTAPTTPTTPNPGVSLKAVDVSGAPASATTYQMTARAEMSDGSTQDVTTISRWESSDTTLATISSTGLLTVLRSGHVDVRATFQNMTGTVGLSLTAPQPTGPATLALSGTATETPPGAKPLAGVTLRLVAGPDTGQMTTTDASGHFLFPPLHAGEIGIEGTKDGYLVWRLTNLALDHDRDLQVLMYPTPPQDASGKSATARCNDGTWSWAATRADACSANGGVAYTVCPGPLCESMTTR